MESGDGRSWRAFKRCSLHPERLPSRVYKLSTAKFKFYIDKIYIFFYLVKVSPLQYLGYTYAKAKISYLQFKFNWMSYPSTYQSIETATLILSVTMINDAPLYNPSLRSHQEARSLSRSSPVTLRAWQHFLKLNLYFPGWKLLFKFNLALMHAGKWAPLVQYQGHLERLLWDDTGVEK